MEVLNLYFKGTLSGYYRSKETHDYLKISGRRNLETEEQEHDTR